jgi:serine/threonine protein kinase
VNPFQSNSLAACPSHELLVAFSSGDLAMEKLEAIGQHLANCESCLAFLDRRHQRKQGPALEPSAAEESSRSSMLDDTALEQMKSDRGLQQLRARAKAIGEGESDRTVDWNPKLPGPPPNSHGDLGNDDLPERVGRFLVLGRLGKGGFADVYLARDAQSERRVAVKVPRSDKFATDEQIGKFLEEARKAGQLEHPNIVPAYDFDRLPAGGCFVVMKYVEGGSLEAAMCERQFSPREIAELCAQIADGLDYAHLRKFVHRDIKPANILLDEKNRPHISDFGLAICEKHQHLHWGERAGTRAYMSPEQVRGESQYLDGRTDVWSLGVILYELLTRQKPFFSTDPVILEDQIKNREPKPPRSIDRRIPEELERICLQCLAKDISARCGSAAEVAEGLRSWLHDRRRGRRVAALALTAITGMIAASLLLWAVAVGGGSLSRTQDKDQHAAPAVTSENPSRKTPLLKNEPVMVFGHPRPDPFFSDTQQIYSVGPAIKPWIARVHRGPSGPVHLHATVSLNDWIGSIGVAWQFHDLNQPLGTSNRWLVAEFNHPSSQAPCRLLVQQLRLSPGGEVGPSVYYDRDIAAPQRSSAELDLQIEDNLITFSLGDETIQVAAPLGGTPVKTWLEPGELTIALTGERQSTTFREVILEWATPDK